LVAHHFLIVHPSIQSHGTGPRVAFGFSRVRSVLFALPTIATMESHFLVPTKGTCMCLLFIVGVISYVFYMNLNLTLGAPQFDGGGFRWPFIFDMCMTCLLVGALLLTVQMGLKQAVGPAACAALVMVPTMMFSKEMKARYLRSFEDAALLQTSLLDGWDNSLDYTVGKREEFRQFLVDAHKAAYVPICLAGTDTDEFLTAEPAVVVEDDELDDFWEEEGDLNQSAVSLNHEPDQTPRTMPIPPKSPLKVLSRSSSPPPTLGPIGPSSETLLQSPHKRAQHGVTLRRTANTMRRRASTVAMALAGQEHIASLLEDQKASISPFERPAVFERSSSSANVLDKAKAPTARRRSIATGSSWRTRSTSSIGSQPRAVSRSSLIMKSSTSQMSILSSDHLAELQEGIELLSSSSSSDPSTSYTNTSGSGRLGDKFE